MKTRQPFAYIDDPFSDPPGLAKPPSSPTRPTDNSTRMLKMKILKALFQKKRKNGYDEKKHQPHLLSLLRWLEIFHSPTFDPPENVLKWFVCKLNPVTRDEDLELIFSRFGLIMSCQVIRDKRTGDSLQYAFIEYDKREDAEQVKVFLFFSLEILTY